MQYIQCQRAIEIQQWRDNYLRTLVAPMDGMWESAVIAYASFWEIQDHGQHAGHFCLDATHTLLRFHLVESYQARAQEIFAWLLSTCNIQHAIASTLEPFYFSLCLDVQKSLTLHSHLFRASQPIRQAHHPIPGLFRKAHLSEMHDLLRFYQANTEGPGDWIEAFLRAHLKREELFLLLDEGALVATGECIPSSSQHPYADLGMVVAQSHRGRGLASAMLLYLKEHCSKAGWKPICSCEATNLASQKAIQKAGFISNHRTVRIQF